MLIGGGKNIPFNVARYAADSDKLMHEFMDIYYLDREFTISGFTILRPSD